MEFIYFCWYRYTFGLSLLIFEVLEMHQTRLYSSEDIALSGPKIKASPSPPNVPCHSLRLYVFLCSVMFAAWVICCCVLLLDAVSHNRVYCETPFSAHLLPSLCVRLLWPNESFNARKPEVLSILIDIHSNGLFRHTFTSQIKDTEKKVGQPVRCICSISNSGWPFVRVETLTREVISWTTYERRRVRGQSDRILLVKVWVGFNSFSANTSTTRTTYNTPVPRFCVLRIVIYQPLQFSIARLLPRVRFPYSPPQQTSSV